MRFMPLPSLSSLLDGLARQHALEGGISTHAENSDEDLQAPLASHVVQEIHDRNLDLKHTSHGLILHMSFIGISDGQPLPSSFTEACSQPNWTQAIDREFQALINRKTWTCISISRDLKPVQIKWVF